ncbi:Quinonprotein alcohol dehydrogenase-like superfamily domain and WD40/YVTN repeat-like-containing domain-containing protein [Strongyloides ratti]|uniref:Quinonprotein alcohol dehydrogenase-like superfamily domain and WD40/YVTN repeat-like-containing domain-containing protein n=1 Tax=Strongyloides ratti TaxID=34506 RepID=A0A090LD27_STRRB|nr:Quinonprotein alcohol dehydrogenase-like superfamily domain and WD40/YVTN repeat-like-containing domain-containing protein [Strongyloides ratti]CEF67657.1 Quinonprotein alcohol dehydrogenase-like superfamily domain and WD40/YVTN repeat-like-containing domain-containing protein [Strongyloides ratti]
MVVSSDGEFVEESCIGANLGDYPIIIDDIKRYAYVISGKDVLVFETKKGRRVKILHHDTYVKGLTLSHHKLNSFLDTGERVSWILNDYSIENIHQFPVNSINWVYKVGDNTILLEINKKGEHNLYLVEGDNDEELQKLVTLPNIISHPDNIAIGNDYAVYTVKNQLFLVPFEDSNISPSSIDVTLIFGNALISERLKFTKVKIVSDSLFAAHSLGRIYVWRNLSTIGLQKTNKHFFHAADNDICFDISEGCNVYVGTSHCALARWNLINDGGGRWQSKEMISNFESPVHSVSLSLSSKVCCIVLEDNSIIFVKTDSMTILCKGKTLLQSSYYPINKIQVDPLNPDLVISDTRHGSIQWMNLVKWQTIKTNDIVMENASARKNYCSDFETVRSYVYLFIATPAFIVTCEKRTCDLKEVYVKFWRRQTKGKNNLLIELEDIICVNEDITHLTGDLEEMPTITTFESKGIGIKDAHCNAEFLTVDKKGFIDIWKGDLHRFGKWRQDVQRNGQWQKTNVVDISSIRKKLFASIHKSNTHSTHLLLWSTENMNILHLNNIISDLTSVKWAPKNYQEMLLVGSNNYIGCFNVESFSYNWLVEQTGLLLYSDPFISFVYNDTEIMFFDVMEGNVLKTLVFKNPQIEVVATTHNGMTCVTGLSNDGFTLLKDANITETNEEDIRTEAPKTAFSKLIEINRKHAKEGQNDIVLFDSVRKAKKILEGAAFALAPISQLAPLFIKSCLIKKQ